MRFINGFMCAVLVTLSLVLVAITTLGARPDDDTSAERRPTSSDLRD